MLNVNVLHTVHDTHGLNPIKNKLLSMVKEIIVVSWAVPEKISTLKL